MPKIKKPIETTRTRRQASKEALKQLQLLLDDDDEDAFVIPDDEDSKKDVRLELPPPPKKRAVSPVMESPTPKKKYKLSHRKSSDGNDRDVIVLKSISNSNYVSKENTLELECFVEELSEVQKKRQKEVESEEKELQAKLDELLKSRKAEVVYTGGISSAVEVNELISNCGTKSIFNPNDLPEVGGMEEQPSPTFQLVMDPRLGIIVGSVPKTTNSVQIAGPAVTKGKLQISSAVKAVATLPQSTSPPPTRTMRSRRSVISTPPPSTQTRPNNPIPSRANSLGVMTRGNATTPRSNNSVPGKGVPQITSVSPTIQTRGMKTTPIIQTRNNKTTPTTGKRPVNVPAEKPKQVVDLTSEDNRNQADNREISFNKLQGKTYPSLVVVARPHLRVTDLAVDRPKLDSKVKSVLMHPPTKFTEWLIQQGVIRAEQKCPVHSNTQLKLGMYSDVTKFPFSGGYVWISECCPQRFVSVFNGSIFEGSPHPPVVMLKLIYHWSCQTNIQNVTQWVKVDNLYVKGVYTWLRGVCTLAVQSRLRQLGGPGSRIEVGVISLGTTSHDGNQRQVKVEVLGVLESTTKYVRLRAVEPMPDGDRNFRKKFSKILEPILHWVHPGSTIVTDLTVDKVTLNHMGFSNVVQTTSNDYSQSNRTIMEYLRRIVPRMFQNTLSLLSRQIIQQFLDELVWREWFGITSQMAFDNIITHLAEQTRMNSQTPLVLKLNKVAANPFRSWNNGSVSPLPSNSSTPAPTTQTPATTVVTPAKTLVAEVKKYGRGKKSNSPQVQVAQERPTKPVSPDVPEQMVPLENYYYGTIDPMETTPQKITLNMKCPFCKSSFDNNILLQNHLFKHAHNVSNDAYLCRYCLTSVSTANELIHHVNKCHPGGTKFDYGFVCLICEIHYMNPFVLGKHMSKEHIPHELPYQCGSCSYRCSNHKQVIDHFYVKHDGGSTIQCPFCLKSTTVWSSGRNVAQNIHYFIQHLQKHQKKQFAKRCGKCNLWFVQKEVLKEHQQKMHISLRGKMGLIPYFSPRNGVMVPKSKMDKNPCDAEVINFPSLYYNISSNSICKECNQTITSSKHFPSFDNCQNPNCQYSTCCAIAMMTHNAKCKGLNSVIPPETLPFEMFCVCGFRDSDGNSMAKHLALCEKKSAYPSEADAKSATVMHSMLDILGLVRKPEENKNEKASHSSNINNKTEVTDDSSNSSRKAKFPVGIEIDVSDEEMVPDVTGPTKANDPSVEIDLEDTRLIESTSTLKNTENKDKMNASLENTAEVFENTSVAENITDEKEDIIQDQREIGEGVKENKNDIEQTEQDTIMNEVSIVSPHCISNTNVESIEESNKAIESTPESSGDVLNIKQTEQESGNTVDITNKSVNLSESEVTDQTELMTKHDGMEKLNDDHDSHKQESLEINEPMHEENMEISQHHEGMSHQESEENVIVHTETQEKPNHTDHSIQEIAMDPNLSTEIDRPQEHQTEEGIAEEIDTIQTERETIIEQDVEEIEKNDIEQRIEIDSFEKPIALTEAAPSKNIEKNLSDQENDDNEIIIPEGREQSHIEEETEKNEREIDTESITRNEIDPLMEDIKPPTNEENITDEGLEDNLQVPDVGIDQSIQKDMLKKINNEEMRVEAEVTGATNHNDEQTEGMEIHVQEEASTQVIESGEFNKIEKVTENSESQAPEEVLSQQTEPLELNENKISPMECEEVSAVLDNEGASEDRRKPPDEESNKESENLQANTLINDILSSADNTISANLHSTEGLTSMEVD
ncbi:uncharacterized protein LOC123310673 [Coccinella septempunctata]|uniref:uncharacterized protein LOC123310673 n=1 Tax=Coccinella septempunctata TaxID=41139 RepID=UPI001D062C15|nr:uncharacterized protein LOC123310673 [Coccinella septempunctata]XP_044750191.1 uncharacterized protein LOC123310673 [Coccinella septempunctata]